MKGNLLKQMKKIYKSSKDCEMKPSIINELKNELRELSSELKLTQQQSFLFSIIFCLNFSDASIDRKDLITHLNIESVDLIDFETDIQKLFTKNLLSKTIRRHFTYNSLLEKGFKINTNIKHAILNNKELKTVPDVKVTNSVDFLDYIFTLMKEVIENELDFSEALNNVKNLLKKHKHIEFIKTLNNSKLSPEDICILLYYIGSYRLGDKENCIKEISSNMYGENGKSANLMQNMATGNHPLVENNFLINNKDTYREFDFELTGKTKNLMRKHKIIPELPIKTANNAFDFLHNIEIFCNLKENDRIKADELVSLAKRLLKTNKDSKIVKKLKELNIKNIKNEIIYLKSLYNGITNNTTLVNVVTEFVYGNDKSVAMRNNEFIQEENELITNDLVELGEAPFISNTYLTLTESSQQLLVDCGIKILNKSKTNYSISPGITKNKPLFYNNEDASEISMLKQILKEENLRNIQKRMSEKALPTGVIALLHGYPGTGKTESVFQFAKQTGREVIQVDISQSKSMWFGESEKKIKKIFTRYEQYAKRCKLKPILLFNEADAIISKRKDASASNVSQTENTIQNILLEELEKFTGICIATTNLIENMDTAFERRFLYKIELTKPNTETLTKIWKSKLTNPEKYNVSFLVKEYQFSGGQIDNIVKKIEMHEIIHNSTPTFNDILTWCNSEKFQKNDRKPIGFN